MKEGERWGAGREGMSRGKAGRDEEKREREGGGYRVQGRKNLMGAL